MFGNKKKIKQLENKVKELSTKSFNRVFWDLKGNVIPLFNFSDKAQISDALKVVPELKAIISYLAKSFSNGIFKYENSKGDFVDNKIIELFNNPNILVNGSDFKQNILENIISYGYVVLYADAAGLKQNAKSIFVLNSSEVNIKLKSNTTFADFKNANNLKEFIEKIEYNFNGKKYELDLDNIILISQNTNVNIEYDTLTYESPLKPLEKALMVTPALYDSMQNLLNNQGMKGFLTNKTKNEYGAVEIAAEDKKELQKAFRTYGTRTGQDQIAFTNNEVNYVAISSRLKDMMLVEQQDLIKTIISDVLGFDVTVLNSKSSNKYASTHYQEARKSMYNETLIPIANTVSEALTNYFLEFRNDKIVLDFSELDLFSDDLKTKLETSKLEIENLISLNNAILNGSMNFDNAISTLIMQGYSEEIARTLIKN